MGRRNKVNKPYVSKADVESFMRELERENDDSGVYNDLREKLGMPIDESDDEDSSEDDSSDDEQSLEEKYAQYMGGMAGTQ